SYPDRVAYARCVSRRRHEHASRDRSWEAELKFRLSGPRDHSRLRSMLKARGGKLEGTYDEENFKFQGPGKSTRRTSLRLRLLDGGPDGILTAKGPARFVGGIKVREETEVAVTDAQAATDILEELGFQVALTYQKHRAIWKLDGVSVTLDTLGFGWFVELEGPQEALGELALSLGLDPALAVRDSYSALARK